SVIGSNTNLPRGTLAIRRSITPSWRPRGQREARSGCSIDQTMRCRAYDPRRPDFIDVAGGLPARTGGAGGGGCCTFVGSGTPCCGFTSFLFLEKSGISFL